jgi:hypothetical protein
MDPEVEVPAAEDEANDNNVGLISLHLILGS